MRTSSSRCPSAVVVGVGAENGLGAAVVRRFAREGFHVFVAGRTSGKIEKVVASVKKAGGSAEAVMVWALAWGMAPVCTQLWLFNSTRDAAEAAQAMNTSVFQLSIGAGSLIGALAVNQISLRSSMWFGAAILGLAVIMVFAVGRMDRPAQAG